jgi:DNA polymerase phi
MDDAETSEGEHVLDVGEESEEPDSDEQDEEDKSDVEENEEVDPEFRLKLEQALGGLEPSGAALDQESEEELMDDEQMLAIDEQLAAIFRSRKGADKKKSEYLLFSSEDGS